WELSTGRKFEIKIYFLYPPRMIMMTLVLSTKR
ncbi:MAG: hypothetical protein ACI8XW_003661, partial [Gammaproteobacteria bacterium]